MVADFDRDGITDAIATACTHIEYFQGLPGGKFAVPKDFANTQNAYVVPPYNVSQYTFLDLNGDGYLDIANTDEVAGVTRLLNTGPPAK